MFSICLRRALERNGHLLATSCRLDGPLVQSLDFDLFLLRCVIVINVHGDRVVIRKYDQAVGLLITFDCVDGTERISTCLFN